MKASLPLAAAALLMFAQAHAQTDPARPSQPGLPPPGLNDPGVTPVPETSARPPAEQPQSTPAEVTATPLPGKPIPLPRAPGDKGPAQTIPDVQVKQEGDRTVQEYRQGGRLYMVVVTPKHGVPQTYMVDNQGRLRDESGQPPVRPVMYKVMEWGKAPRPADSQDDGSDDSH